jgi:hypothetical protein
MRSFVPWALLLLTVGNAATAEDVLTLKLEAEKSSFAVGEPMLVWLVFENRGDAPLRIPNPTMDALDVTGPDGKRLPYVGWIACGVGDGSVVLPPKGRLALPRTPSLEYGVTAEGTYVLEARSTGSEAFAESHRREDQVPTFTGTARSEPLRLTRFTRQDPGLDALADCLRRNDSPDVCILGHWRSVPEGSFLTPYAAIAGVCESKSHGAQPDLRAFRRDFERRFRGFDQPLLLLYEIGRSLNRPGDEELFADILCEAKGTVVGDFLVRFEDLLRADREQYLRWQAADAEVKRAR